MLCHEDILPYRMLAESSSPMMLKKRQIRKLTRRMLTVMQISPSSLLKQKILSRNCWYFQTQLLFGGSFVKVGAWYQRGFLVTLSIKLNKLV